MTPSPPSSDRVGDYEVSSSRARLLDVVPIAWLDMLLAAVADLPLEEGEASVVEALIDSIAVILPTHAVGACFVPESEGSPRGSHVVKRLPEGLIERPAGTDPTRIFPGLAFEHVVAVPGCGSTLHLASEDHELDPDGSAAVNLLERAATALGRALPSARSIASSLETARHEAAALEQRMVHADKLATFGQVAAGVVHELNNPLTSIVAYSDYLIRRAVEAGDREPEDVERLRRISESANRILRFTRDLVSYARPSVAAPGPVVVHAVIDRAIAFCEHVLAAAGMRVERAYAPDVLTVSAASEQLVQVFVNLITNACQAAPSAAGRILVATSRAPAASDGTRPVVVVVEDNGTGIAPENLSQVFAPFFTTKGDKNGTGLGLSIVKRIVGAHDGDIRVESELGRGTRFVIELPERR
ncbi:MAG TPA: ATP-binding protein [Polyangiaceae bacterium]|jgi:signal transduction histidine kinase|nr:ATP-binding protein [Polyangiaceae bacterium]